MLQKDMLLPYRTIEDNVALPLLIKGEKKKAAREKVQPYFQEFGLEGTQKKYPAQLSGGMRQRAALLRTYLFSRKLALLDEPFSALDTLTKSAMHRWYLQVMERSICPRSLSLMTWMRLFYCRTGFICSQENRDGSQRRYAYRNRAQGAVISI